MKRYCLVFFIYFFVGSFLFAQNHNVRLEWNNKFILYKGVLQNFPEFKNSIHLTEYDFLPIFRNNFNTNSNNCNVKISNCTYKKMELTSFIKSLIINYSNDSLPVLFHEILFQNNKPVISVFVFPFRINPLTNEIEVVESFNINIKENTSRYINKPKIESTSSVLSHGDWFKISVNQTGICKISYQFLKNSGLNPESLSPSNFSLFGNGGGMLPEANNIIVSDDLVENSVYVYDANSNNSFDPEDYIAFYAQQAHEWKYDATSKRYHHIFNIYDENNYYFFTFSSSIGSKLRITDAITPIEEPSDEVNSFTDYAFYEKDIFNDYKKNIKSGKEWMGETFELNLTQTFNLNFPNILTDSLSYFRFVAAAHSPTSSSFSFDVNGINVNLSLGSGDNYATSSSKEALLHIGSSNINISTTYNKSVNTAIGFLNNIEVNITRPLIYNGNMLLFRNRYINNSVRKYNIIDSPSNLIVWDVTSKFHPKKLQLVYNANNASFKVSKDSLNEFIAFDGTGYYEPIEITSVTNQNLHGLTNAELVIISPVEFLEQASRLATFRNQNDNLNVAIVTPEQIYNEFSSGRQDVSAIRNFARMLYNRNAISANKFQYLLLFGDASYDYKDRISANTNIIPTYESDVSDNLDNSYATDDYYCLLDDSEGFQCKGLLDIGVGRFPVNTIEQAKNAVDKIIRYASNNNSINNLSNINPQADWRNTVCFVVDDGDNGEDFISDAERLETNIISANKNFNIDKIYCDVYTQVSGSGGQRYPEVNEAIRRRMERGALIVNYVGHGGGVGWAHERILQNSEINSWGNYYNMPLFVTATCEFSQYDDPERIAAGEYVFLNPNGGGIALYTTSRPTYGSPNINLNSRFYENIFHENNGIHPRLGDATKYSKSNYDYTNERKFVLLADPSMRLAFPSYNVKTLTVNSKSYNPNVDTLKALALINITGALTDYNGNILTNFNGNVYPAVYDKPSKIVSNGNDNSPIKTFFLQKNILFKGKVTVENGLFEFSFIVPRDLASQVGYGKISYYAENGIIDANGNDSILAGSINMSAEIDTEGPQIKLFMDDTLFVSGNSVNENAVFISHIFDKHGINASGNGLGHDIVAVIDENNENPLILNEYYISEKNSFSKGIIRYPFYNLTEGMHNVELKVWDTYNNSSTIGIDFFVVKSEQIVIDNLKNYPNPFFEETKFSFNHNQSGKELQIELNISDVYGRVVKELKYSYLAEGSVCDEIIWDGTNNAGAKVAKGIYIYQIILSNKEEIVARKSSKLVYLK